MDDLLQTLGLSRNHAPEDNAVCFALYPASCAGATEEDLDALRVDCVAAVLPHIERYIWQRDAFTLTSSLRSPPPWERPRPPGRRAAERQQQQQQQELHEQQQKPPALERGPPCLWGAVAFGDSVDDEWFVAWLALELTRRFEGLAARVWDDDGEFLLIEAAYSLPRWLKPEVGAGRTWLLGGRLHVVPLPSARHPTLPASPSTAEALAIVRSEAVDTLAPRIEAPVLQRLSGYPAAARANTHTARALLPRRAAAVLKGEPQLIGPAVEAFYCRDPDDTRAAARPRHFPPRDLVSALVPMSRAMYAQLLQQTFAPPKGSGFSVPPPQDPGFKAADLGLKISAGLEMVCRRGAKHMAAAAGAPGAPGQQQQPAQPAGAAAPQRAPALAGNPAWRAYISRLEASGYFQGELPGSRRHRELLGAAEAAFSASDAFQESRARLAAPAERAAEVLAAAGEPWEAAAPAAAAGKAGGSPAPPPAAGEAAAAAAAAAGVPLYGPSDEGEEDGDGWMREHALALERQVDAREAEAARHAERREERRRRRDGRRREGEGGGGDGGDRDGQGGGAAVEVDAAEIAGQVRGFLQHLSGYEGAEVPQQRGGGGPGSSGAAAAGAAAAAAGAAGRGGDVRFDPEGFLANLAAAMGPGDGGGDDGPGAVAGLEALLGGLKQAAAAAGVDVGKGVGNEDEDEDEGWSSSEEGSSFFGSGSESGSEGADEEDRQQHRAGPQQGQQRQRQQLPDNWLEVPQPPASAATARGASAEAAPRAGARGGPGPLPPRLARLQELWEVRTATDSDDDGAGSAGSSASDDQLSLGGDDADEDADEDEDGGGSGFEDAYAEALDAELAATRLADSFERAPPAGNGSATAAAAGAEEVGGAGAAGLRPVDLDLNLVKSLMASYTSQGGLPGPASNLAGLLGLTLPNEEAAGGGGGGERR